MQARQWAKVASFSPTLTKERWHLVRVGGSRWHSTYTEATSTDAGLTWKKFASFPASITTARSDIGN
ncbi:hypothetical protein [Coleofasciculus sp. FACHB-T130]|uniref:hypothetical protein n=1 Tax=Cyanophyceae TaxID=3028117 RepID=UPI001682D9CB|nr:hypothetical protein [Coleofasciculus sp. FACHB-T130]MBD1879677.1 hypothetical protein [Coleofasciculus sp. FACHB-T130]